MAGEDAPGWALCAVREGAEQLQVALQGLHGQAQEGAEQETAGETDDGRMGAESKMKPNQMWAVSKSFRSSIVHRWKRVGGQWYSICGLSEKDGDLQQEDAGTCKRCLWAMQTAERP